MLHPKRLIVAAVLLALCVTLQLIAPEPAQSAVPDDFGGLRVEGRHLYDGHGNKIVLVGINKMVIWRDRDGLPSFTEIAKTGANAVRVVWLTEGTSEELDIALSNAISSKLIPIVDCHDTTGKWELLSTCVDYWVRPDIVSVLKRHEDYLLINIANEAGSSVVSPLEFCAAYELAIRRMRAVGLHMPLVIDAQGWGQNINDLQRNAPYLTSVDPDHNLMFSVHMWWPSTVRGPRVKQEVIDEIAESVGMELPLLIGEFANKGPGCTCCIPYKTIIEEAHANEVGYLAWSWGPGNSDCDEMDMTEDGTFETLHGWGLEVALTNPHSIQAIAVRPQWLVAATPVPPPTPAPTATPLPAPEGLLSIGKPVTVSSVEQDALAGAAAVDGRLNTRWSSAFDDPQEIVVDLGEVLDIGRIVLEWETAYAREYKLQVSQDGTTWQDIAHVVDGDGGRDDTIVSDGIISTKARYVRMRGLERGTEWGYSLWEFWVFDRADRPLPEPDGMDQVTGLADSRPDLVVTDIEWSPDPPMPDQAMTFRATVENLGSGTAYRDRPVACLFQVGGETIAQGTLDRPLGPGTSTVVEAKAATGSLDRRLRDLGDGANVPVGIVVAWVDPGLDNREGVVDESDETNNFATAYGTLATADAVAAAAAEDPTRAPEPTSTSEAPAPAAAADSTRVTPEPPVLLPKPIPRWGWLAGAAALVIVGSSLVMAVLLRRPGNP